MTIHLHLLNARGKLEPIRERVENVFSQSVEAISALLPISNIDVVIQAGPFVIPETGMVGYSPSADVLYLTIEPSQPQPLAGLQHGVPGDARARTPPLSAVRWPGIWTDPR